MIWRRIERRCLSTGQAALRAGRSAVLQTVHSRPRRAEPVRPGVKGVVLALRLDRLSDLVLTLPAIDDLAAAHPEAKLVAVVPSGFASLVKGRRSVTSVMEVPEGQGAFALASRLSIFGATLAVAFSPVDDLTVPRAVSLAGIPFRVGFDGAGRGVFLTHTVRIPSPSIPIPEAHSLLVAAAGGMPSTERPSLAVGREALREAELLLRSLGAPEQAPRIAIHPGGVRAARRWPPQRFAEAARGIARQRGGKAVILAGSGEEAIARAVKEGLRGDGVILPPGDLGTLAAVLSRCDLLLANDSGPFYLAGAVGLPAVCVMGPTDPRRLRTGNLLQAVIRKEGLPCSPCSRFRCGPHDCLLGISPEEVVARALDLLDPIRAAERVTRDPHPPGAGVARPKLRLVRADEEPRGEREEELAGAH